MFLTQILWYSNNIRLLIFPLIWISITHGEERFHMVFKFQVIAIFVMEFEDETSGWTTSEPNLKTKLKWFEQKFPIKLQILDSKVLLVK